jgi:predicted GNAT family acetyltransferase
LFGLRYKKEQLHILQKVMKLDIKHYYKAEDFLAQAGKYLAKDEAHYGLIIGIAKTCVENKYFYGPEAPWFCSVSADPKPTARLGSEMYAAAWRTPPFMVGLVYFSGSLDLVANELVTAVSRKYKEIPGVVGDKKLTDIFAGRWCGRNSLKITRTMAQKLYKLVKVNDVPMAPGKLRQAVEADRELVKKWSHGFHIDCFGENSPVPETDMTRRIETGEVFLWDVDGKPVSMAEKMRPTDKGMTVGGVYTPPEFRKKGYATSCVAQISRSILESGKMFCTLYTDLANPTSNSIYKKIGYVEIADSVQHEFGK